jgi:hypothetical protein
MHMAYKWSPQTESAHLLRHQTYPTKRPRATVGFVSELPGKSASILPACEECRPLKGTGSGCSELVRAGPRWNLCAGRREAGMQSRDGCGYAFHWAGMPWRRGAEWTGGSRCAFFRELMLSAISRLDQGARGNSDASDANPALRKIRDTRIQLRGQDVCNDQGAKPSYEANIR